MHVDFSVRRWSAGLGTAAVAATLTVAAAQQPGKPASGQGADASLTATATLKDSKGQEVGRAALTNTPNGVLVRVMSLSAPAGPHAFHIHETGRCDAPSFESAGGHFNPDNASHGFKQAAGPHAGDLPNVHTPANGQLSFEFVAPDVTLAAGQGSLFDGDGSALVLHAGEDDYVTEPAGDAGSRLACGVIERQR
jgi:Cu-Zn family superoxide dismutase